MISSTAPQELVIGRVTARAETHGEWVTVGEPDIPGGGGEYLFVQVERVLMNVALKDENGTRRFTMLETVWQNLWDYRLSVGSAEIALVDSHGFQHRECRHEIGPEMEVLDPTTHRFRSVKLPYRERTLEGLARARMPLWFESLTDGAVPERLVVEQLVFSPGATSGRASLSESIELTFADTTLSPATSVL